MKKYIVYDTPPKTYERKPVINVHPKGSIMINRDFSLATGISEDDKIALLQDKEDPGQWLLLHVSEGKGLSLRIANKHKALVTHNSVAARALLKSQGFYHACSFPLSLKGIPHENGTMYPIITVQPIMSKYYRKNNDN